MSEQQTTTPGFKPKNQSPFQVQPLATLPCVP